MRESEPPPESDENQPTLPHTEADLPPLPERKIIVIEDQEVIAYALQRRIEHVTKLSVRVATSLEALNAILDTLDKKEILVAVSDLHLPDAPDGEVVQRLGKAHIPVIVMTGDYSDEVRDGILQHPCVIDYYLKGPECLAQVAEVVDQMVRNVSRKVLIADDAPNYRLLGKRALESLGFHVLEAENGREALAILEKNPEITLLLTDNEMPLMNGLDLVWQLRYRREYANLCIIGLSARESNTTAVQFLKRGANDFLAKPFEREELLCRVFQHFRYQDLLAALRNTNSGLAEEVMERRKAEERARALAEEMTNLAEERAAQLVRADRMATLGTMSAAIAHEVSTPLGAALTASTVLDADTKTLQEAIASNALTRSGMDNYLSTVLETSTIIQSSLDRANDLMQGFKTVSVDQASGEHRTFLLRKYIDDILLSLRPNLKRVKQTLTVECPEDLELDNHPGAISQLLTNLIMNSLIHAFDPQEEGRMTLHCACTEADWIVMAYADNGRGIEPDVLPHIFEQFFTTKRGAGGSGLGMYIAKQLVEESLGGTITCQSTPGEGTQFLVKFPRIAPPPVDAPSTSTS